MQELDWQLFNGRIVWLLRYTSEYKPDFNYDSVSWYTVFRG